MPQHRPDQANITAIFEQPRGEGMPEEMTRPALGHAREGQQPMHPPTHQTIIHRPAIRPQEEHIIRYRQRPPGPDFRQISRQPSEGPRPSRDVAVFPALSFSHPNNPALGIKIGQAQAARLGAPQAGCCQEFYEGSIPHTFGAAQVTPAQHRRHFIR